MGQGDAEDNQWDNGENREEEDHHQHAGEVIIARKTPKWEHVHKIELEQG